MAFFALFKEDMTRNGIDDQNNDDIIDDPQDILEEDVEDDDDNNNDVVHTSCPVLYNKSHILAFSNKKPKFLLYVKYFFFSLHFC